MIRNILGRDRPGPLQALGALLAVVFMLGDVAACGPFGGSSSPTATPTATAAPTATPQRVNVVVTPTPVKRPVVVVTATPKPHRARKKPTATPTPKPKRHKKPTPTPTAKPKHHRKPTATPTPKRHARPTPTATPKPRRRHRKPTPTPTARPRKRPHRPTPTPTPRPKRRHPKPTATPIPKPRPKRKPTATPTPASTRPATPRLGRITHPAAQVQRIQQGADSGNPSFTPYLLPLQVVRLNLPQYGFKGVPAIFPKVRVTVQYGGHTYDVFVLQPLQRGPRGIWVINQILPRPATAPVPAGLHVGAVPHSSTELQAIQNGANAGNAAFTYYLNPVQVVRRNLPRSGFTGPITISRVRVRVDYAGKTYGVFLSQPGKKGPTGIWLIDEIRLTRGI